MGEDERACGTTTTKHSTAGNLTMYIAREAESEPRSFAVAVFHQGPGADPGF